LAYVSGVAETLALQGTIYAPLVPRGRFFSDAVEYMQAHSESLYEPAVVVVRNAAKYGKRRQQ
jgi:hypothetical protein